MCLVFSSCLCVLVLICFDNPKVRFLDFGIKRISLFFNINFLLFFCCFEENNKDISERVNILSERFSLNTSPSFLLC